MTKRCEAAGWAFAYCPNKQAPEPNIENCTLHTAVQAENTPSKKRMFRPQVERCTGCPFQSTVLAHIPTTR